MGSISYNENQDGDIISTDIENMLLFSILLRNKCN